MIDAIWEFLADAVTTLFCLFVTVFGALVLASWFLFLVGVTR